MRNSFFRPLFLAASVASLTACAGSTDPSLKSADGPALDFATDSASYTLRRGSFWLQGSIGVTYTNRTSDTAYFVNCHGGTGLLLQKRVGDEWKTVWTPVLLSCLSAPITVAPGAQHRMAIEISAGSPGSKYYPQFDMADAEIPGTYRVEWIELLTSYQPRLPFGNPVVAEHRLSNTFAISVQ